MKGWSKKKLVNRVTTMGFHNEPHSIIFPQPYRESDGDERCACFSKQSTCGPLLTSLLLRSWRPQRYLDSRIKHILNILHIKTKPLSTTSTLFFTNFMDQFCTFWVLELHSMYVTAPIIFLNSSP